MRLSHCIFAFFLTMAVVLSAYGAMDRWNSTTTEPTKESRSLKEAFDNQTEKTDATEKTEKTEAAIKALGLQNPTDSDAIQAHKTLLRYTQANFSKGIAIIINIAHQFYGPGLTVRKDLDPATLMVNYTNPL